MISDKLKSIQNPDDAMFVSFGTFYKVGHRDNIYFWDGCQWILSNKTHDDIAIALNTDVNKKRENKDSWMILKHHKKKLNPKKIELKEPKKTARLKK